jgi:hypothetical protein
MSNENSGDNIILGCLGTFFALLFIISLVGGVVDMFNGGGSGTSTSTPNSDAFDNASDEVQEDVIIYQMLRMKGFSDAQAKKAVIDSM